MNYIEATCHGVVTVCGDCVYRTSYSRCMRYPPNRVEYRGGQEISYEQPHVDANEDGCGEWVTFNKRLISQVNNVKELSK